MLHDWRRATKRKGDIPKEVFPSLLSSLNEKLRTTVRQNLVSGFRSTGILPLDREAALKRLPDYTNNVDANASFNATLIELLKENRGSGKDEKLERGKKIPKMIRGLEEIRPGKTLKVEQSAADFDVFKKVDFSSEEICFICKKDEPEESVDDDIEWVGCDTCPRWYHRICLRKMDINATSCIVCVVPEVSDYSSSEDEEIEVV